MADLAEVEELAPGSDAAIDKGCKCPVLDNGHGRGYMGQPGIFVISDECKLHGIARDDAALRSTGRDV